MIKHYTDIQHVENFFTKPWLILGTGPSIAKIQDNTCQYNIWAINLAGIYCQCKKTDMAIWSLIDRPALEEVICDTRDCRILTSSENYFTYKEFLSPEDTFFIEYESLAPFLRLFPDKQVSPTGCSSATAVRILGELGIRKIFTAGIDGGIGERFHLFADFTSSKTSVSEKIDYTLHNLGMDHWARVYNISIEKL